MLLIISLIFLAVLCLGACLLVFKIIKDSMYEGDLGINFSLPNCPNCGRKVPAIRNPTSIQQAMWGGWTCSFCSCEIDKWGKEIKVAENKLSQEQIKKPKERFIHSFDETGKTPVERIFEEK